MRILDTSAVSPSVGLPVKHGTVDFLQTSYKEVSNWVAQSYITSQLGSFSTASAYIIKGQQGTVIGMGSGPIYDFPEAIVYYNDELFSMPGIIVDSGASGGGYHTYAQIATSFDTSAITDPVTFTDYISRNIHQIRSMTITSATGSFDYRNAIVVPTTVDLISSATSSVYSEFSTVYSYITNLQYETSERLWVEVGTGGSSGTYSSGWAADGSVYGNLKYTQNLSATKTWITGAVKTTSTVGSATIFTLPAAYRPSIHLRFPVTLYNTSTTLTDFIHILTTGEVQYTGSIAGAGYKIYFNCHFLTQ